MITIEKEQLKNITISDSGELVIEYKGLVDKTAINKITLKVEVLSVELVEEFTYL